MIWIILYCIISWVCFFFGVFLAGAGIGLNWGFMEPFYDMKNHGASCTFPVIMLCHIWPMILPIVIIILITNRLINKVYQAGENFANNLKKGNKLI